MGQAARDAYFRRTTPGERFDSGVEMLHRTMTAVLADVQVPEGATPEERARIQYRALRRAVA